MIVLITTDENDSHRRFEFDISDFDDAYAEARAFGNALNSKDRFTAIYHSEYAQVVRSIYNNGTLIQETWEDETIKEQLP